MEQKYRQYVQSVVKQIRMVPTFVMVADLCYPNRIFTILIHVTRKMKHSKLFSYRFLEKYLS